MYVPTIGRRTVSSFARTATIAVAVFVVALGVAALAEAGVRGPAGGAFLAIVVTFWFCAGALTALVLFGQYYVTGSSAFALVACAYEFVAVLALPYLLAVPGVLSHAPPSRADLQVHLWLWWLWHLVFPGLVAAGFARDPLFARRMRPRGEVRASLAAVAFAILALAVAIALVVWSARGALAVLETGVATTALFRFGLAPLVLLANASACAYVVVRSKGASSLSWYVALALFAAAVEGAIAVVSPLEGSVAWYLGAIGVTVVANFVLAMVLVELGMLYGKLTDLATHDALTGLHNRRGLDEYLTWAYDYAVRRELGLALLVVDIDHFKRYNDRYGHALGDLALRRVASLLRKSTVRRYDLVARYGGEEFVVALFNVGAQQAAIVAERLKGRIEAARIPHAAVDSGRLSVSIGVGQVADAAHATLDELFAAADRALYAAKEAGRDRYMLATLG